MAAATVFHFGVDCFNRVLTLRHAGYEVRESDSLVRLELDLEGDDVLDAVIVSGVEPGRAEMAAALVRKHSVAPLILFSRPDIALDERRFDRVYPPFIPTGYWLFETAVVVMQCKELRAESERLHREAAAVRAESQRLQARSKAERQRNADAGGPWKLESDEKM